MTQLLSTFHDWAKACNSHIPNDIIFMDMAKAFDSVPHERLLRKLYGSGIDGSLLDWFRSFVIDHKQRVNIRGTYSEWTSVTGTPQGTILGSILLILLYINDITENITSTVKLYTDNTKIYKVITDKNTDTSALQTDLNRISEW